MLKFITLCTLTAFLNVQALAEQDNTEWPFVEILSQPEDNAIHKIRITVMEDGGINQVIRESEDETVAYPFQDFVDGEVVMAQSSEGKDVLILSCAGCSATDGGIMKFKYLYNGINDTYRDRSYDLIQGEDAWSLFSDAMAIENMTMTSNRVFGIVVGIREILLNDY